MLERLGATYLVVSVGSIVEWLHGGFSQIERMHINSGPC